ncbi:MAG: hypothetical protein M1817_006252 [Caeruleum heppii]|nr:MAG: hypothetical protein M1817_006252 [Caeruleum heppii]
MLSRLLSVAAAATAASLVGNTERAFSEAQDVGGGSDGTFDGFLQALQNGSLAAALRNGGNEMGGGPDAASPEGNFTPVNFFRMFRFASTTEDSSSGSVNGSPASGGNEATTSAGDGRRPRGQAASVANERDDFDAAGGRMVPVIIVGIRSVMPRDGTTQDDAATPPLFDALSNLPLTMPNGLPRGGSGTLMRRTDRRSRFSRDRRASMSAVNPFPANYDSQRHQRMSASAARTLQDSRPFPGSPLPTVLSDSPPGPHPPPSTPADHGLSAMSSATNTPSRRPSSASVNPLPNHALPRWRESGASAGIGTASSVVEDEPPPTPSRTRRRRLSDSEFSRYRDFGSGSSRRNGIVGDSEVQPNSSASRASNGASNDVTRSWIIYVLGGSYPEDHPILTTPSLFTDSPTYEDMLLLSSLLGVAKPPVATREEVASAPGVYRVTGTSDGLVAENVNGDRLQVLGGERCLVCLCDYEIQEEIRQLTKCGHTYHRECIDEWLTTGRNSCPLCRGQGVDENSKQRTPADPAASTANTPS